MFGSYATENFYTGEKRTSTAAAAHTHMLFRRLCPKSTRGHVKRERRCAGRYAPTAVRERFCQLWPAGTARAVRAVIQTLDLNHWYQIHHCLSSELPLIHALKCFIISSWWSELHFYQNQISILVVHIITQRFALFECTYALTSPRWCFLPLQENKPHIILLRNDTDPNICGQED